MITPPLSYLHTILVYWEYTTKHHLSQQKNMIFLVFQTVDVHCPVLYIACST